MSLSTDITNLTVTSQTTTLTQEGFGTALFAVAKVPPSWGSGRVRAFSSAALVLAAGFLTTDPAYQMVATAFAQEPAPATVKIGRRTRLFAQVVHITPSAPTPDEVYAARIDGVTVTFPAAHVAPTVADVRTGLAAAVNARLGADADAIIVAGASAAAPQVLVAVGFDGVIGPAPMTPARRLSFLFSSSLDWDPTVIRVYGLDPSGAAIFEDFAVATSGTPVGTRLFSKVTRVEIPAQTGPGGTFTMGVLAAVTAAVVANDVVCTASALDELHRYEPVTTNLTLADVTDGSGIAADLAELLAADRDWYGLALDSNGTPEILAAAAWAETNKKLFVTQTADTRAADPSASDDVLSALRDASLARTVAFYYPAIAGDLGWLAAGVLGSRMPRAPGSDVWAFKQLKRVTALAIDDTAYHAVVTTEDRAAKNGNVFAEDNGAFFVYPGMTSGHEWADLVRGLDWLRSRLRTADLEVNLANERIEFSDEGIRMKVAAIYGVLTEAVSVGLLARDPAPTVTAPLAKNVPTAKRAARKLPGVTFAARANGGIQSTDITGVVGA